MANSTELKCDSTEIPTETIPLSQPQPHAKEKNGKQTQYQSLMYELIC